MIINNSILPFGKNYIAINLFGIIFTKEPLSERTMRHELIHTSQLREMLFVGFYLWYVAEWMVRFIQYRKLYAAYRNISFEREAYANEHIKEYRTTRRRFAWVRYLCNSIEK